MSILEFNRLNDRPNRRGRCKHLGPAPIFHRTFRLLKERSKAANQSLLGLVKAEMLVLIGEHAHHRLAATELQGLAVVEELEP